MANILAVDDDKDILILIQNILRRDQHLVHTLDRINRESLDVFGGYDLILLDVMMPDIDGFELCKLIRPIVDCPIIFLTAKTDEEAVVKGLMTGGDDYISKPFGVLELSARVNAHLRRENREKHERRRLISGFLFHFDSKEVFIHGQKLNLTKNEYKICEFLAQHKGRTFSREQIYEEVYGLDGDALYSTITEFIRTIRKKCKEHHEDPIKTVWGVGYKWE
ncbi:transcriptional regulatory protein SpaR [Bacillus glycinifermentans]|uniref:Response regulator transcription factor n=1 Tax=Bacillus glycinifermentans TaxID=1664069 RepID=A0A0J6EIM5_9BACI|nr:response regulator transcription factor [Bacillus glycinifermentans]ATH94240.1 DNA-binding response regulator [Bacillus glycinifermentans]KMM63090.1 transcriptional regulatory protein SpaR [Bacillus glycinifermentans]KRT95662.1 two-component system response regulator [Bacillus glycinifermentans]MEC0484456.1 response regulator transcription factor [Bacillus glycinifermentans]MEC0496847.1 response regulator transcription factor [Bacillus glycinifermentans]